MASPETDNHGVGCENHDRSYARVAVLRSAVYSLPMDVLTDVLSTLRLQGTLYFHTEFRAPWGQDMLVSEHFNVTVDGPGDLLIYPEGERGKIFWAKVYEEAYQKFGVTDMHRWVI